MATATIKKGPVRAKKVAHAYLLDRSSMPVLPLLPNPIFATSIVSYALTGFGAEFSYLPACRALYSGAPAPLFNGLRDGHAGMDSWRQLWHFT